MPRTWDPASTSPEEALRRLVEGNRRFRLTGGPSAGRPWSKDHAEERQRPFAVILGCSDARTPVEILFDQGFGDLFVVRVAGNSASPTVVGSIEFAVSQFGIRLVVVMGHTHCGAIEATVRALETGEGPASKNIRAITDRITPHVRSLVRGDKAADGAVLREAMRANVRAAADHLRHGSDLLEELVTSGRIAVACAEYEIETGAVALLDEAAVPAKA